MNVNEARTNMIEQQIRPWEVLDPGVLGALNTLKREEFVPPEYRDLAFVDMKLPLGFGEVMPEPRVEARMAQAAGIKDGDRALEVGTGTGYMAALLATLGARVLSVEMRPEFAASAKARLVDQEVMGVNVITGDGVAGWPESGPYDVIVMSGSLPYLDVDCWLDQLNPDGRMVAIVGNGPVMEATLLRRVGATSEQESLFDTILPPLANVETASTFIF